MTRPTRGARAAIVILTACLTAAPTTAAQSSASAPAALAGLDSMVAASMRQWGTPGVVVAFVRADSIAYLKGYGVREQGKAERVDEQTVFAIGSATKAMTAASLGMLVDEGRISWDDRAAALLPHFEFADPLLTAQVTLRDLLSHRTGLPGNNLVFWGTPYGRDELLRRVRYLAPNKGVRAGFEYQNMMYLAAGQVIPAVTGRSWDDFIVSRLFAPLGMTSTTTSLRAARDGPNVATPHQGIGRALHVIPWLDLGNVAPAGAVLSNARDMAAWVTFQLGDGSYRGTRLLTARTLAETHTPQIAIRPEFPWVLLFPDKPVLSYGLGWFISDYRGERVIEHGGDTDGMSSMVTLLPNRQVGFVILTNAEGPFLRDAVKFWILDALTAPAGVQSRRDWNVAFLSAAKMLEGGPAGRNDVDGAKAGRDTAAALPRAPSHSLDTYAGTYHNGLYGDAVVTVGGNALTMQLLGAEGRGTHARFDTFRFDFPNTTTQLGLMHPLVTFELDEQGRVADLQMVGMRFTRASVPPR